MTGIDNLMDKALDKPGAAPSRARRPYRQAWWTATLAALVILPFVLDGYVVFQMTLVLVYALAIIGLNLLTGINGQFSLGHVAFFATGAYTTALLMDAGLMGYAWTLPIAGIVAFVFGFLFGLPALRLEGIYLALATFALSVATPQVLKLTPLTPWTHGVNGISLPKPEVPWGLPLDQDQWIYFFVLAVVMVLLFLALALVGSRSGRALLAIRDNPIAARAMGINIWLYKATAFGISSLYAGIAGGLSAIVVQYVSPDSFTMNVSIAFFVGMVLGGLGWLPGALFGGAFIVFIPQISADIADKGFEGIAYGLCLVVLVFVMPSGLAGGIDLVKRKFAR